MTNLQINPRKIVQIVVLLTIGVVGLMRLHLSLTRAFDPDEFAYLHWTWLSFNGHLPYRDFFFYILPGFPWFLAPLLAIAGNSVTFLIVSRIVMLAVYGLCAGVVYTMTRLVVIPAKEPESIKDGPGSRVTPGMTTALLATLIFLTFPVTIDKTIDVRPDMVMLVFYFASVLLLFQPQKARPFQAKYLVSGMLFSTSALVLPKILFSLPALMYLFVSNDNYIRPGLVKNQGLAFKTRLLPWVIGASIVGLGFIGYLAINNLIPQAITSITKDALAVTSGKGSFSPLTLLSPYPLIYLSTGGVSLPWAVNTGIWIVGLAGLLFLFKMNRRWAIFWSLFIAGNIVFVILFPVPYVQYLLPLSVAGSVLGGITTQYGVSSILGLTKKRSTVISLLTTSYYLLTTLLLLSSFFLQYRERVTPGADNREQLQVIRDVLSVIKPNETIYDMVGSYVFRPDGFFICCHPYAEFVHKLGSSLPAEVPPGGTKEGPGLNLTKSLIAHQTKFLIMDRVGFVFWKSLEADKAFLLTNYLPMGNPAKPATPLAKLYSLGQTFLCHLGACVQYDMDGKPAATRSTNTFTIIAAETYTVSIEPNSSSIMIDGKKMQNNQAINLSTGTHRFATDQSTTAFRLQIKRNEEVLREFKR